MLVRTSLVLSLFVTGCSLQQAPDTSSRQLVGKAAGTDVVVGAALANGSLDFYACGGPSDVTGRTHWFKGTVDENGTISAPDDAQWVLAGQIDDRGGQGTVTPADGGAPFSWSLRNAGSSPLEGLYTVVVGGCRTGVVITHPSTDESPSLQGATCVAGTPDVFEQVLPIFPVALVDKGLDVQVIRDGAARRIYVERAAP